MSTLGHIEALNVAELRGWLERALRGQETLPLVVPDEHPFLAIARAEDELDRITRKDLRRAALGLVNALARGEDDDDAYVASLIGLVRVLDVREATSVFGSMVRDQAFGTRPPRQRAAILGALIDMRHPMPEEFWLGLLGRGQHQALALSALLRGGPTAVKYLAEIEGDQDVADAVYVVLSQHAQRLEPNLREQAVQGVRAVVQRCRGEVRAAVQEWLDEQGAPIVVKVEVQQHETEVGFMAAYNHHARHRLTQLRHDETPARLIVAA